MSSAYVAGKWADRDKIAVFTNKLRGLGYHITSRWHDVDGEEKADPESWYDYASRDRDDVYDGKYFILFTEHDPPKRNSRLVELGLALAYGKEVVIIGPLETIFCTLADFHYATAEDCLTDMAHKEK